ncbi:MAG TPA: hypothetical protein VGQ21_15185 [Thermoanaerobaculia bacterium]|jgi:hypothetical protein|nr:hypothetical protein [Thermoanaerobaculia bacterium]
MIRTAFVLVMLAIASAAAGASVAFVDSRAAPGGNGTRERPFARIAQGVQSAVIVYVAESDKPYEESVTLKKGQMLIGSAFGLDALRADMHVEFEGVGVPAMQGPGPSIRGTIVAGADNVIAGCTMLAEGVSAIVASNALGTLTIRNVYFKTSQLGFAIYLVAQQGNVNVSGGAMEATNGGGGIALDGGYSDVVIDRVPISGEFNTAVRIQGRRSGTVTFRRGSKIHVRDAFNDAIVITGVDRGAAVVFEDTIDVRGRRRGVVIDKCAKVVIGGASTLNTANGAALEVHDSGVDLSFESVSAQGVAPGTLDEGIILDRIHGKVSITGLEGKIGTGGAILHARGNGIRIDHADHVRMAGLTITDSGVNKPVRGARCAGNFEVNSTAICRAALYLRHITDSTFENIVIDGGSAMGINANNIRGVTFGGLDVHRAGDETFESGVLLQEVGGTITFSRSSFADNAGSEMLIEQRFNNGKIVLDRCVLSATGRPDVAPHLLELRSFGNAKVDVELRTADLHDNLGSAFDAAAAEGSSLSIDTRDSSLQHFGHGIMTVAARQSGNARITLRGNTIVALASDRAWIDAAATDAAGICADIAANRFSSVPGTVIHLAASPQATLHILGLPTGTGSIGAALAAANGGAVTLVEGPALATENCR